MQGLYDGMNFLAGVVSALGFIALVLALIGLGQKPRGFHFMFSILTFGFFALLALPAAVTDISTLIFVKKELAARPSSQMDRLPSIYFPQENHEILYETCWGNLPYGCLYKLAAHGGDVFLETGTDPIYRWTYVENNPECFNENRVVVFLYKQPQLLARGVCFLLSEVETSEAELRYESGRLSDGRRFGRQIMLIEQKTGAIIDRQLDYVPWRSGYPMPLGNKMRQMRGLLVLSLKTTPMVQFLICKT
ncbi:MAG: hypothetical protein GQ535_00525 [Rhodobacteraceae bacterium]|nr:hypothetical protein [Paracoccaceae bacterium]